jgi:cytochrome c553
MLPPPPPLSHAATTWSDAQLFWIVQNGIKYTGMPAWVALGREDEVWAMVAFLRALPGMSPDEYRRLVRTGAEQRGARELARFGTGVRAIAVCARCHGAESVPPASPLVPVVAGQSVPYLERALRDYASGVRRSGMMQPVAAELGDESITALARYYNGQAPVQAADAAQPPLEQIRRGQNIATLGIPSQGIPACLTCHAGSAPMFPRLAGQHAAYVKSQLDLWRRGLRADTVYGAIMAPIARRLTPEQGADVAAFFASIGRQPAAARGDPRAGEGAR